MLSWKINDIKNFMHCLLVDTTFDFFSVSEASVTTFAAFSVSGSLNSAYFEDEKSVDNKEQKYASWAQIKPFFYQLIRGSRTPSQLKISFMLPESEYEKIISLSGTPFHAGDISGIYLQFKYENRELKAVASVSPSVFSMDKTLEHYWDDRADRFLSAHFDALKL